MSQARCLIKFKVVDKLGDGIRWNVSLMDALDTSVKELIRHADTIIEDGRDRRRRAEAYIQAGGRLQACFLLTFLWSGQARNHLFYSAG